MKELFIIKNEKVNELLEEYKNLRDIENIFKRKRTLGEEEF